ncbi:ATPdependent RNA helicase [Geranomyces variabilis]|uniref:ATPdependent RNA helicase n=1 Tax=Geranomyces variabilis TaxID=109894 RepID=A0AAD5TRI2_9FUNG|nr:ATPdependent RNA helicase [Geranomyces variabilis]
MGPNRQKKSAKGKGKDKDKGSKGGRSSKGGGGGGGGGFRGIDIKFDPVTDEVIFVQKNAAKNKQAVLTAESKAGVNGKDGARNKKRDDVPELRMDPIQYKRLHQVLTHYKQAQKILKARSEQKRLDNVGGIDGSDGSELDSESEGDDEDEDDYDEEESQQPQQTASDLVREMNSPAFYGHEDDFLSDEIGSGSDSEADAYSAKEAWSGNPSNRSVAKLAQALTENGSDAATDSNPDGFDMWDTSATASGSLAPKQLVLIPDPDPQVQVDDMARAWLEAFGFLRHHVTFALQQSNNDQLAALAYLYSKAANITFVITSSLPSGFDLEEAETQRETERLVLESMYMDDFSVAQRKDGTTVWQIKNLIIPLTNEFHKRQEYRSPAERLQRMELALQLHHSAGTAYPFQTPLVTLELRNKPPGCRAYDAAIIALATTLQTTIMDRVGEEVVDMLTVALQTAEAELALMYPSKRIKEMLTLPVSDADQKRVFTLKESAAQPEPPRKDPGLKLRYGPNGTPPMGDMLRPNVDVLICLKEDQGTGRLVRGKISQILTKQGVHTRGVKVRLTDMRVGRVAAIVEDSAPHAVVNKRPASLKSADHRLSEPPSPPPAQTPARPQGQGPGYIGKLSRGSSADGLPSQAQNSRINASLPASPKLPLVIGPSNTPKPPRRRKAAPTAAQLNALSDRMFKQHVASQQTPAVLRMLAQRTTLPAWKYKDQILDSVEKHRVVVVEGETGCGKTTQVPQFILDRFIETQRGAECKILVTQPRRISAIGVAERVASERGETIGKTVGYQIRLESRMSEETRILFATTGIMLRRLEGAGAKLLGDEQAPSDEYEGGIDDLTHVIVDEVHERSVDSDFLLMVLRDLLVQQPTLKLILMSATLNAGLFQTYFGEKVTPRIHVPGRTFPVEVLFLEDALAKTQYQPVGKEYQRSSFAARRHHDCYDPPLNELTQPDVELDADQLKKRYPTLDKKALASLRTLDVEKIQYPLIELLVEWMCETLLPGNNKRAPPGTGATPRVGRGAKQLLPPKKVAPDIELPVNTAAGAASPPDRGILIFLPGFLEISTLHDALSKNPRIRAATGQGKWCIPLHGNLSSEEQLRVFKRPETGSCKIVIATNVAETSITIDDVVYVVDSGKMKETRYDPQRSMASLEECWVSQANARQRRGRAGRVTKGLCVHLFTSHTFEHHLAAQQVPEMQRTPLEQLCLRIKVLPFLYGKLGDILNKVIEPPSADAVRTAILTLRTLQALTKEEALTPLGFHLGRLPLDVRIGKLLVFGSIFQCLDPVLTIAAAMSAKSPFVAPFEIRNLADQKKREFAVENSDQLTILNAYNIWQFTRKQGYAAEKRFLFDNFLSGKSLTMIANVKRQLAELIGDIGFIDHTVPVTAREMERAGRRANSDGVRESIGDKANIRGDDLRLVKALLLAALYPNVIKVTKSLKPSEELVLFVKGNEEVFIHPSSINYRKPHPNHSFLVYHEKVRTSKVYIRDASLVPPFALAFFAGAQLAWDGSQKRLNMDDGWIRFRTHSNIATVVQGARAALDELLAKKIREPGAEFGGDLVAEIVRVVTDPKYGG